jgi:hypothetical protein
MLAAHRGVGVAVSDFSTSIHRFIINNSIQSLGAAVRSLLRARLRLDEARFPVG